MEPLSETSPPEGPSAALLNNQGRQMWETRLLRADGSGGWISHLQYQQNSVDSDSVAGSCGETTEPARENDNLAAVYYDSDGHSEWIRICSNHLIKAIRDVNKHPPLHPVQENLIVELSPYPTLFHHLADVRQVIDRLGNEDARLDFQALEYIVTTTAGKLWKEIKSLQPGLIRYDLIWSLFYAGDLVVWTDDLGNEWLLVLVEVKKSQQQNRRRDKSGEYENTEQLEFVTWGLVWDGTESQLSRKIAAFKLPRYEGLLPIDSLPVLPLRLRPGNPEDFKRRLTERGRKWWELMTKQTTCHRYNALAYSAGRSSGADTQKLKLDERVVLDREARDSVRWTDLKAFKAPAGLKAYAIDSREDYQWDDLPASTSLTESQASLCPPLIDCHGVATKKPYTVSIEKLEPADWNSTAMQQLVLPADEKAMLQGLVAQHYLPNRTKRRGDIIAGKGEGLVILLHGPPGVGKTLTAESVAEVVQKPLIALSIGHLIRDESEVQERLEAEFKRAIDWDAILLLDEADIVLEARSFEDLRRNSIVSVFLRTLEYYQGVLFLTTNRISTMDTAFQSRIQIGISFKHLTAEVRKRIWTELLDISRSEDRIEQQALQDILLKMDHLAEFELNGRQIRNALNIADGYAFNEFRISGKMEYRHIQKAVDSALEFQRFFGGAKSTLKLEQSVWAPYRGGDSDLF